MKLVILILQQKSCVVLFFLLVAAAASPPYPAPPISKPGCRDKCGNESVPYPFGFGRRECFKSRLFELNCTYDYIDKKEKLSKGAFEIANISLENATAVFNIPMLHSCNKGIPRERTSHRFWVGNSDSAFTFSSKQNKFTVLGCNTVGQCKNVRTMPDRGHQERFLVGCFSGCYRKVNSTDMISDGGCSGLGCCQTQIPKGSAILNVSLYTELDYVKNFSPCSYAFLAKQGWDGFNTINLTDKSNVSHKSPVVVDWVVRNETCGNFSTCGDNANCTDSPNGLGHSCSCKQGYEGNPYLGCQDIDECKDPKTHNCEETCKNTEGSFTCRCPLGAHLDDKGSCKGFRYTTLAGVTAACLALVAMILFLWMECKRSNKARNFLKNGGTLLKNQEIVIYKEEELKKATKNYDHDQLLGKGGFGFVYKGELRNKELVAIKKPKVDPAIARGGIGQYFQSRVKFDHNFQNEIKMICSVNHKNVVKLKGLCLETIVPLLVYEYVPNKSLYHHIHIEKSAEVSSWKNRLRIAYDTAVALNYLHVTARSTTSIIHGDVKSKNILLDEDFIPKVADFGASVLVPSKQNSFSVTKVHGTRGYLDPEYLSTSRLTVKSDVYSFGVVLMELLTSQKPISEKRPLNQVDYVSYFVSSVEDDKLEKVIDYERLEDNDQEMKLQVEAVAKLAVKCLNRSSLGRPDMDEVEKELGKLNARNSGVRVDQSNNIIEEKESIVSVDCSDNISMPSCSS
ncbi:hypothetical protein LguiA_008465 [Lonicera macranthoides]